VTGAGLRTIRVGTAPSYEVHAGEGASRLAIEWAQQRSKCLVVADAHVWSLHGKALAALSAPVLTIPAGEAAKSLATIERVADRLAEERIDRDGAILAFGGGVVGDVAGLAAALWNRGIAWGQAPTTLLAQVDSSVGGKTAVNLRAGKNLVGAFHQPSIVAADTRFLASLPHAEWLSGLGEVLKTAIIEGEAGLARIEEAQPALARRDSSAVVEVVAACVAQKAFLVARDPHERGERRLLNLGHTFGHALETTLGHGAIPHGVAVGIGVVLALRAAELSGKLDDAGLPARVEAWMRAVGLPTRLDEAGCARAPEPAAVLEAMRLDKKNARGRVRLVLPLRPGVLVRDVEVDEPFLLEVLARA
jgi:3-dehydroquinate synthase